MKSNPAARPWYFDAVFYQVYPQSFLDTNGDGIGDLPGIIKKLDYLKHLGVDALWLSPIFESPFSDAGYDVADYYRISPRYGTMADLKKLIKEAHQRGMRILLDAVYNHTSYRHHWFAESRKMEKNPFSKWYMWSEKKLGGWWIHNDDGRHDLYLSEFHQNQISLNFGHKSMAKKDGNSPSDPDIKRLHREMQKITAYWLDLGVDGFRCDVPGNIGVKPCGKDFRLLEKFWGSIRRVCDSRGVRPLIAEEWMYPIEAVNRWGFNMVFSLHVGHMKKLISAGKPGAGRFRGDPRIFDREMAKQTGSLKKKDGAVVVFTANHDSERISESAGENDRLTAIGFLMVLIQNAVPKIYQGDEIGMRSDHTAPWREWSMGRAQVRTPVQWSAGKNAGFSTASPEKLYLPVTANFRKRNVEAQMGKPGSLFEDVRRMISCWKSHPALHADGKKITINAKKNDPIYAYARQGGGETLLVVMNLSGGSASASIDIRRLTGRKGALVRPVLSSFGDVAGGKYLLKGASPRIDFKLSPYAWQILEIVGM